MRGGEEVRRGREALDEGARRRQLPVLFGGTVSSLPALGCHVALETLHTVAHPRVEPAGPGQATLGHPRSRKSRKGRDAIEFC